MFKGYLVFADWYSKTDVETGLAGAQATTTAAASDVTPEEQIDAANAVLHSALKADLLQRIMAQSPSFSSR